jgi:S-adenosylmethionine:tRNA ribosyltransferase-isomerase
VIPAAKPRARRETRILVVDGVGGALRVARQGELAQLFEPGDLLVFNDAATLPASLRGRTARGDEIELRLAGALGERRWTAALLGAGDFHVPTESRPPPPPVAAGDSLFFAGGLTAEVTAVRPESPRLVEVALTIANRPEAKDAEVWATLYRAGRVVQYAYVPEALALWDVQNVYAARPWAVEMPSAGRAFDGEALVALAARGVETATVTHAAGLSSVGDPAIDALLPLPERYEVREATWEAIDRARRRGGRIVAVGTSTVRALEGGARAGRRTGITDLRIGPGTRRAVVDAVITGVHDAETSHFSLLGAFTTPAILTSALACAEERGLLGHELGDACLVWGRPRHDRLSDDSRSFASLARTTPVTSAVRGVSSTA